MCGTEGLPKPPTNTLNVTGGTLVLQPSLPGLPAPGRNSEPRVTVPQPACKVPSLGLLLSGPTFPHPFRLKGQAAQTSLHANTQALQASCPLGLDFSITAGQRQLQVEVRCHLLQEGSQPWTELAP